MSEIHPEKSRKEELVYREETRKLCERIVEFVNPGAKVPVHWKKGAGWFWNFKDNYIVMDERDLETKSREYCIGVALHESMHVWMSRTEYFTDDEWKQLGFAIGFNFAEDCSIENAAERVHKDGKRMIKSHLDVDVQKGGGLDISINQNINSSLGYIPKHMILGGVMRQYFHGRQIAGTLNENGKVSIYGVDTAVVVDQTKLGEFTKRVTDIDADVSTAFDQIRPLLEKFWDTVPEMYDDEESIKAFAQGRTQIYRDIWEIYKKLVERSVEEQALNDFIDQLVKGGKFTTMPMPGGGEAIVIDFDSLPPEVQKELTDLIKEQQDQQQGQSGGASAGGGGQGGKPQPGQPGGQGGKPSGSQAGGSGSESSEESGDEAGTGGSSGSKPNENQSNESGSEAGDETGAGTEAGGKPSSPSNKPAGMDQGDSTSGEAQPGGETGEQPGAENAEQSSAGDAKDDAKTGAETGGDNAKPGSEGKPGKVPMDKVSPESKQKIKDLHDKLDESTKQDLKDKAEQELGAVEDEVNEKIGGKSDRPGVKRPTKLKDKKPEKPGDESGGSQAGTGELGEGDEKASAQSPKPADDAQKDSQDQSSSDSDSGDGTSGQGKPQKDQEQKTNQKPPKPQSDGQPTTDADDKFSRTSQNPEPKQPQPRPEDIAGSKAEQRALKRFYDKLDIGEADLPLFDQVRNDPAIREACDILKTRLEPIFKPRQKKTRRYSQEGPEIEIERVIALALRESENKDVMYSEERPTRMNYRFTILVDLSSSMTSKLEEVFKMIVILAETLSYLGIEFEVQGFTDKLGKQKGSVLKTYKPYSETTEFGENLRDDAKNRIGSMLSEDLDGTPTSTAMLESFDNLKERNLETSKDGRKIDIMLILTDGKPTDKFKNVPLSSEDLLRAVVAQIQTESASAQMALAILGLGIGSGTHFVNEVFPILPFGLRNDIANELNNYYYRMGLMNKIGGKPATAEDIGNSFLDTFELTVILPTMFEYIIKNPNEFTQPNKVQ